MVGTHEASQLSLPQVSRVSWAGVSTSPIQHLLTMRAQEAPSHPFQVHIAPRCHPRGAPTEGDGRTRTKVRHADALDTV